MAGITVEEFVNKIGFQVDQTQLAAAENMVNKAVNGMASGFSWLVKSMAPLAAGFGLFEIGKYAITSAANVERLTAQFEVMLGGADKATKMVKDIQTLAAATPLTSVGVTESVKTLLAFGVAGKDAISTIRMLGDVAGGDQERLNRLSYAYGQTMTAGRLMGQDLLQYINVGFSPLKVMGDNLEKFGLKAGMTQNDLRKMMSQGQISAEMVTKAFQIATSEGGMFYQNMEKQSKTLSGLWSTMVDNIQLSLINAIQPLIPLMKNLIDWVGKIDWTPMVTAFQMLATILPVILDNFSLIYPLFIGIFGARALTMIGANTLAMGVASVATKVYAVSMETASLATQFGIGRMFQMGYASNVASAGLARLAVAGKALATSLATAFAAILTPVNVAMVALVGLWMFVNKMKKDTASMAQKEIWAVEDQEVLSGATRAQKERAKRDLERDVNPKLAKLKADSDAGKYVDQVQLKELLRKKKLDEEVLSDIAAAEERVFGTNSMIPTELINATKNTKQQTVNVKNEINQHIQVDDKGDTKVSRQGMEDFTKMAIRDVFNVQFMSLSRVPA